jgi:hypothetical protein
MELNRKKHKEKRKGASWKHHQELAAGMPPELARKMRAPRLSPIKNSLAAVSRSAQCKTNKSFASPTGLPAVIFHMFVLYFVVSTSAPDYIILLP